LHYIEDIPLEDLIKELRRLRINQERLEQENRILTYQINTLTNREM